MVSTASGRRAVARCDLLGSPPFSDAPDMLFRAYLTPSYARAQEAVAGWMIEAGMEVRIDPAANLVGRYEGLDAAAPALVIGSHLDSVRDGGRYDGPLGIMLGIECVAALSEAGRRLPFPIEVYAFGDEEGSRFPAAMLTSRAMAGTLDPAELELTDDDGMSLDQALRGFQSAEGVQMPALDLPSYPAARHAGALAYLEAHIEQGPVLEAEGLAVGVVTGIAAQLRYAVTVDGMAGHAGTTSMPLRRDALAAAAEMVLAVEQVARSDGSDLVATVGRMAVAPGAANVIAGRVDFTLDVRSGDPDRRDRAAAAIAAEFDRIAARRGVGLDVRLIHDLPASPCDPALMAMLDDAVAGVGERPFRLVSGAGHDAMVMAALCATAMLFIRCAGGISHNPAESVDPADADVALAVMRRFVEALGENRAT